MPQRSWSSPTDSGVIWARRQTERHETLSGRAGSASIRTAVIGPRMLGALGRRMRHHCKLWRKPTESTWGHDRYAPERSRTSTPLRAQALNLPRMPIPPPGHSALMIPWKDWLSTSSATRVSYSFTRAAGQRIFRRRSSNAGARRTRYMESTRRQMALERTRRARVTLAAPAPSECDIILRQ